MHDVFLKRWKKAWSTALVGYDVLELERSCNWGLGLSGKVSISRV